MLCEAVSQSTHKNADTPSHEDAMPYARVSAHVSAVVIANSVGEAFPVLMVNIIITSTKAIPSMHILTVSVETTQFAQIRQS
jgi:hypothetical protein